MEEKMGGKVEKIEKLDKVGSGSKIDSIAEAQEVELSSKTKFDAAVVKAEINWERATPVSASSQPEAAKKVSLIDEISLSQNKIQRLQPATIDQITAQAEDLKQQLQAPISMLEEVVKKNPNAKISPAVESSLSQRIVHIDSSLRNAAGKVGVEVVAPVVQPPSTNPLVKFLGYLTSSDRQLNTIIDQVRGLDLNKNKLTPGQLLSVQIKMNFVQQQLEFFTNILNKSLEAVKTTMNVQV